MNCPECNSTKLVKRGFRNRKQRYKCSDCGRCFTEGTTFVGRAVKLPAPEISCLYCGSEKVIRDGLLETGGQRYKCPKCGRGFSVKTVLRSHISDKDKKTILMFRLNLRLPISEVANHFNCSKASIKRLIKESGYIHRGSRYYFEGNKNDNK